MRKPLIFSLFLNFVVLNSLFAIATDEDCKCDFGIPEDPKTLCLGVDKYAGDCQCQPSGIRNIDNFPYKEIIRKCGPKEDLVGFLPPKPVPNPGKIACPTLADGSCGAVEIPRGICVSVDNREELAGECTVKSGCYRSVVGDGTLTDTVVCEKQPYGKIEYDSSDCDVQEAPACGGKCTAKVYDATGKMITTIFGTCSKASQKPAAGVPLSHPSSAATR